jgi:hypothetical protein
LVAIVRRAALLVNSAWRCAVLEPLADVLLHKVTREIRELRVASSHANKVSRFRIAPADPACCTTGRRHRSVGQVVEFVT